jgi:hypothetical protein
VPGEKENPGRWVVIEIKKMMVMGGLAVVAEDEVEVQDGLAGGDAGCRH